MVLCCMALSIFPVYARQIDDSTDCLLSVRVLNGKTGEPVDFAVVVLIAQAGERVFTESTGLDGVCHFKRLTSGSYKLQVVFLGYKPYVHTIVVEGDSSYTIRLDPQAVDLDEVVVTALESQGMTSSSKIDRQAMEHRQPSSFSDLVSLLPGERTTKPMMGAANLIRLREAGGGINASGNSTDYDISSLGTSFLMDGVPISTKANLSYLAGNSDYDIADRNTTGRGLDMRTISTDDIEKVEVVRGIPSVEYGDLTSGLIKIDRRKGGNQLNARFKADAYGKLAYVGKGFEWKERHLTLNTGIDFLDSRVDPRNTLENYKRFNASVRLSKEWHYGSGKLSYGTNLDYGGSFDNMKIDPEINYHKEDSYKSSYNRYALANNLTWESSRHRFFRSVELNTSISLQSDKIDRTRYVSLSGTQATPPLSDQEGVHDGSWLPAQYVATGGVESLPFYAYTKLVARFGVEGNRAKHDWMVGSDWQMNKNYGRGQIYDPLLPISPGLTTRPRPYYDIPAGHDFALFFEDRSTVTVGRNRFEVQAGLRASTLLNISEKYDLRGKFFFDPRVNLRWSFPQVMVAGRPLKFEIGGGVGWHTMTPSLSYLYPDPIYYDWLQLNYYHPNPEYRRLNLKTYVVDPTNYQLQAARNFKWEIRGDITFGENRLSVTYFREDMHNGYRSALQYQVMNYRAYDASGIDQSTLTAPPSLENLPYQEITAFGTYGTTANGTRLFKEGIEYQFVSKRIPALRTRITIDGAWFRTLYSDSEPYWYRKTVTINGQYLPYLGHYNDPNGYWRRSFNTRFMFDTYLPKLKLGFSASIECMWLYRQRSLRQYGIPYEYVGLDGVIRPFDEETAREDPYLQHLIITYSETNYKEMVREPLNIGMNLKVTKKLYKDRIQLALFVDQLFSYWREYKGANGVTVRQTGNTPYFGMEINFNL